MNVAMLNRPVKVVASLFLEDGRTMQIEMKDITDFFATTYESCDSRDDMVRYFHDTKYTLEITSNVISVGYLPPSFVEPENNPIDEVSFEDAIINGIQNNT